MVEFSDGQVLLTALAMVFMMWHSDDIERYETKILEYAFSCTEYLCACEPLQGNTVTKNVCLIHALGWCDHAGD